ncbi:hypothetical protein GWI33_003609, partial [Rhynchophorus ferrugineus]
RLKGFFQRLSYNESIRVFNAQPPSVKIHSMPIQDQGVQMPLEEWKQKHDCLLKQVNKRIKSTRAAVDLVS